MLCLFVLSYVFHVVLCYFMSFRDVLYCIILYCYILYFLCQGCGVFLYVILCITMRYLVSLSIDMRDLILFRVIL